MSSYIKDNAAAALPANFSLTMVPSLVAGWVRPRQSLIWGELRQIGKQMVSEPANEEPPARRPLRFAI